MPKPRTSTGEKNLISKRLIKLREKHNMSQRLLAYQLQLNGYDMDKNVITRIETNKRYVTDVELKALLRFSTFHTIISSTEKKTRYNIRYFRLASRGESYKSIAEICGITAENAKEILE